MLLTIINNEFIRNLRYKKKMVLSLLIPVIAIVVAIGINSFMKPSIIIGVIDREDSNICEDFVEQAASIEALSIKTADEESIITDMILAKYSAIVIFNEENKYAVKCLDSEFEGQVNNIMKEYFSNNNLTGFITTLDKMKRESMSLAERSGGLILLTLMIMCTLSSVNIIKDKEAGLLKRFQVTPHNRYIYILGNYFYTLISTMCQILISMLIIAILPIDIGIDIQSFVIIGIFIALIASSFSCLIVNICNTELQACISASAIAMLISLIGGAFLPLQKMPQLMTYLSNCTVTKWLIQLIGDLESKNFETSTFISMGIIGVLCILFVIIGSIIGERKFYIN